MMNDSVFEAQPHWIWLQTERAFHRFARFRRGFEVAGQAREAVLRVTADARYEVWLNGQRLGQGPPRSWPEIWPVDEYDLRGLLLPGANVLAVRAYHFGIGTFQYLHDEPGLLGELVWRDSSGARQIISDASWRCREDARFAFPVPRISCQQGWEEQFDAQLEADDWTQPDFQDADWSFATPGRAAGIAPHPTFEKRDIPFLSEEVALPKRLLRVEAVRAADQTWSLMPRPLLNAHDLSANMLRGRAFLATYLVSERAQRVQFHQPHHGIEWKLNGQKLRFDDFGLQPTDSGVAHAELLPGANLLLGRLPEMAHEWAPVLNVWSDEPVRYSAQANGESAGETPWLFIGPFEIEPQDAAQMRPAYIVAHQFAPDASLPEFEQLWQRASLQDVPAAWIQALPAAMCNPVDVFGIGTSERVLPQVEVRLENRDALLCANAEWTTIHPARDGDVRLLLDWGDELVGPHEWELDAPQGAILDLHCFEFIQRDGRINLCEGMNNSLRYVCREGVQTYRTFGRRGFRYAWLSLRNFERPIRLKNVRAHFDSYPQNGRGAFACSDALLGRIWEVGARSVRCCAEDAYTDCPSYEQTHWVGDARNESLVDLMVNGDARLSRHCWLQAARSLDRSSLVESQVPSAWQVLLPAWSFLWMRWAQEHFQSTGDRAFGLEVLPFLQKQVEGIQAHLNARGLFQIHAWNMFDWAPMDTPAGGVVTHLNCLAVLGLRQSALLARALGEAELEAQWNVLADDLSRAINRDLWDESRAAYADCIRPGDTLSPVFSRQTQTAAFIAGVCDAPFGSDERQARCRDILEAAPPGFVEAGSPFFMFFVLEALAREERGNEMLDTIREYWGRQIEAGATTFWETYFEPSHAQEHGAQSINGASLHRLTRSHCHGWSAAPTFFLSRFVLGARPLEPGYQRVLIAPQTGALTWAQGRIPTPQGDIEILWTNHAGQPFTLDARLPPGVDFEIRLPRAGRATINGHQVPT